MAATIPKLKMGDKDRVSLRGHQALCLLGFRGLGYSPAFVDNMTRVFRRLQADDATPVRLVSTVADLCGPCPHLRPAGCGARNGDAEAAMQGRDGAVLARLGIGEGETLPWREVKARIAGVLGPQELQELCASCPWLSYGYCLQGLRRLQAAATGAAGR